MTSRKGIEQAVPRKNLRKKRAAGCRKRGCKHGWLTAHQTSKHKLLISLYLRVLFFRRSSRFDEGDFKQWNRECHNFLNLANLFRTEDQTMKHSQSHPFRSEPVPESETEDSHHTKRIGISTKEARSRSEKPGCPLSQHDHHNQEQYPQRVPSS